MAGFIFTSFANRAGAGRRYRALVPRSVRWHDRHVRRRARLPRATQRAVMGRCLQGVPGPIQEVSYGHSVTVPLDLIGRPPSFVSITSTTLQPPTMRAGVAIPTPPSDEVQRPPVQQRPRAAPDGRRPSPPAPPSVQPTGGSSRPGCVANLERRRERASRSVGRSGGEQLKLLGQ